MVSMSVCVLPVYTLVRSSGGQRRTPGGPWIHATVSARKQNSMASFWLSFSAELSHLIFSSPSIVAGMLLDHVGADIPSNAFISGQFAWLGVASDVGRTRRRRCSSVRLMRSYVAELANLTLPVSCSKGSQLTGVAVLAALHRPR